MYHFDCAMHHLIQFLWSWLSKDYSYDLILQLYQKIPSLMGYLPYTVVPALIGCCNVISKWGSPLMIPSETWPTYWLIKILHSTYFRQWTCLRCHSSALIFIFIFPFRTLNFLLNMSYNYACQFPCNSCQSPPLTCVRC